MSSDTAAWGTFQDHSDYLFAEEPLGIEAGQLARPIEEALHQLGAKDTGALKQNPLQKIVDGMLGQVAIVDADWLIIAANAAWTAEASQSHCSQWLGLGKNYKHFREWSLREGFPEAARLLEGLRAMEEGRTRQIVHSYASDRRPGKYFHLSISRFQVDGNQYATISRFDMSELYELRRQRFHLSASLLRAQEEERQRVARDLHDTAAQFLVGMNLGLTHLRETSVDACAKEIAAEMSELLEHFHRDLRGLTYLLHPPELQHGGLYPAINSLCRGFGRRSGIEIELRTSGDERPRSSTAEATIYRIVQEALSNVHRHAQARNVRVRLAVHRQVQFVVIEDDGIGLRSPIGGGSDIYALGVGIPGMIARVAGLGGRLSVHDRRSGKGTIVVAAVPTGAGGALSLAA